MLPEIQKPTETTTAVQVVSPSQGGKNLIEHPTEIGTIAAILIAFALGFAKLAPKLGLERKEAQVGESLYTNLDNRIKVLTAQFDRLQIERDQLHDKSVHLTARLKEIDAAEIRNNELRESLALRDRQNQQLIDDLLRKNTEISDLQNRLHQMEMRIASDRVLCSKCSEVTTRSDFHPTTY